MLRPTRSPREDADRIRNYRYTTLGAIHKAGFRLGERITEDGHTNVLLPASPTDADYRRLSECFAKLRANPNPVAPPKRRKKP
jgi:hypothetical protein